MAGIATGTFKKFFLKRQASLGAMAAAGAAGSARSMRRVTSTLDKTKANYKSAEINESQQVRDMRHGAISVGGTLTGELSVGGYQQPMESVLRQAAQNGASITATSISMAASASPGSGSLSRSAGSFITDGLKTGDVVLISGFTTTGLPNNARAYIVSYVSDQLCFVNTLDGFQPVAKAAGDNVTVAVIGKKIWTPASGQTRDYYTVEHWFGDIGQSEVFTDVVFSGLNIGLPPSGMGTIELPMMGLNMTPGQAQYFTSPSPAPAGGILAAVNGRLMINQKFAGLITGLTISVATGHSYPAGDGVVGTNLRPDILPGTIEVTGQITVLFADTVMRDLFLSEAESSIIAVMTADNSQNPQFTSFVMTRVKYTGATKDDSQTGIVLTMPFQALEDLSGGADTQTTLIIQDSAFV